MARPFKCVCDRNPSYFQFVKYHAALRVKVTTVNVKNHEAFMILLHSINTHIENLNIAISKSLFD